MSQNDPIKWLPLYINLCEKMCQGNLDKGNLVCFFSILILNTKLWHLQETKTLQFARFETFSKNK